MKNLFFKVMSFKVTESKKVLSIQSNYISLSIYIHPKIKLTLISNSSTIVVTDVHDSQAPSLVPGTLLLPLKLRAAELQHVAVLLNGTL